MRISDWSSDVFASDLVTGQPVASLIANARNDPTFLLADVEIVAEYRLYNINRTKLERLIHRGLGPARLDLSAGDIFGKTVQPREWFFAALPIISDQNHRIRVGPIPPQAKNTGKAV